MALNYAKTNTFVTATTISSSAVNANFDDVVNAFTGIENKSKTLSNLLVDTLLQASGVLNTGDGTVSAPAMAFVTDTGTGLYRIGTSNIGVATAGTKRFDVSATAATLALPLAMGANKITGLANGTVSTDATAFGQLTGVRILQVVTATTATGTTTSSTSFVDTNLTVSITPASSSSKFFVWATGALGSSAPGTANAYATLNGTTTGNLGNSIGLAVIAGNITTNSAVSPSSLIAFDSPASASAQTYKVQLRASSGASVFWCINGELTRIIVAELG